MSEKLFSLMSSVHTKLESYTAATPSLISWIREMPKQANSVAGAILLAAAVLAARPAPASALENGLARTPPMGWLAWERFTCQTDCGAYPDDCINAHLFETMAERLVADGYRAAGYHYVNIDDCWSEMERDPLTERLRPNAARFPDGMGALAALMHQRGLRLGLYGDCGARTCAGYPGQVRDNASEPERENYFELDARTLADWQLDSFKFDGCHMDADQAERVCPLMAKALGYAGRPVLLVCEWPFYMMYAHARVNFTLAQEACNVWRYYEDIYGKLIVPGHCLLPEPGAGHARAQAKQFRAAGARPARGYLLPLRWADEGGGEGGGEGEDDPPAARDN